MKVCEWWRGSAFFLALLCWTFAWSQESTAGAAEPGVLTPQSSEWAQQGLASWYGGRRWQGRRTASGERLDRQAMTAAHPDWPLGRWLCVRNEDNGREVRVRVNDRGPSKGPYIIDLSEAAARRLGFFRSGRAPVRLWACDPLAVHN